MKDWSSRYWNSFSFVGLVVATLFFSASITPSLLPRNYIVQGLLSGFAIAVGYAVGICGLLLYDFLQFPQPTDTASAKPEDCHDSRGRFGLRALPEADDVLAEFDPSVDGNAAVGNCLSVSDCIDRGAVLAHA